MPVFFIQKGITPSNKTQEYTMQLSARVYGYKNSNGDYVNVLYPVIDKLSVTFPVNDEEGRAAFDEAFMDIHKKLDGIYNETNAFSSVSALNKHYKLSTQWTDQVTGETVLLQCKPRKKETAYYVPNYVRFELNPDKLGSAGMSRFKAMLEFELSVGNYPYSRILDTGRITRADIAVDMINLLTHELIIAGNKTGKTIKFLSKANDDLETAYLDKPKTGKSIKKVYNKLQEQIDHGTNLSHGGVYSTRAEYTHAGGPFANLANIQNPFKKMAVNHPIYMPEDIEDWVWQLFLNSCRFRGVDASIDLLPKNLRKPCQQALDNAAEATWRPDDLWNSWNDYLMKSGVLSKD